MRPFRREKFRFEGGRFPKGGRGSVGGTVTSWNPQMGTPLDLVGIFDLVFWSFFWFSPEKIEDLKGSSTHRGGNPRKPFIRPIRNSRGPILLVYIYIYIYIFFLKKKTQLLGIDMLHGKVGGDLMFFCLIFTYQT